MAAVLPPAAGDPGPRGRLGVIDDWHAAQETTRAEGAHSQADEASAAGSTPNLVAGIVTTEAQTLRQPHGVYASDGLSDAAKLHREHIALSASFEPPHFPERAGAEYSGDRWTDDGNSSGGYDSWDPDSNAPGDDPAPGGVVAWSLIGDGWTDQAPGSDSYSGTSVNLGSFLSFDFQAVLRQAFDAWATVADIEFIQVADGGGNWGAGAFPTIRIAGGDIDGAGSDLAWAYFPSSHSAGGDIVFDSEQPGWTQANFLHVAMHEIGHAIGLEHQDSPPIAVMNPSVNMSSPLSALQPDDINGIRQVYGSQDSGPNTYYMPSEQTNLTLIDGAPTLTIVGNSSANNITGSGAGESFRGAGGDDTINGGGGTDRAVFSGTRSQYTLTDLGGGSVRVAGPDGADTLSSVEQLVFADQTVVWPPPGGGNDPPVITSDGGDASASKTVFENNTAVTTVTASDPQGTALVYSIVGGADAQRFSINSVSGVLSFVAAPDFEAPSDANGDNSYVVQVRASDGSLFDEQTITVAVLDVAPVISGDNGDNNLGGTSENDTINGLGGNDALVGGGGGDTLNGGDGDDTLNGGADADTMRGGAGRDRYFVDHGGDVAIENAGEGLDTIIAFLDHTIEDNVEDMVLEGGNIGTGNAEANRIDGHGGNNTLNGRAGNDLLIGYGGDDRLDGGIHADTLLGGAGNDVYVLENGGDVVVENAGEGIDTIVAFIDHTIEDHVEHMNLQSGVFGTGNALANVIDGNSANNVLNGRGGADQLFGHGGNDTLEGGAGDDRLDGGLNADVMRGGAGNDRYMLDNGGDVVVENAGEGIDTIVAFIDHTIEDHVEHMNLQSGVFGTGNALANVIDGNSANNVLNGRGGKDVLTGYGGADTLTGGDDDDTFVFRNGSGADTITDMQGGVSAGDVIDIREFGFASFNAVMAATTDVSGGARIQLDGDDTVFVQSMTKALFDSNDFLLA